MRITEAQAKRLLAKVAQKTPTQRQKPETSTTKPLSKTRQRLAVTAYEGDGFQLHVSLPYNPRPKKRPRFNVDIGILEKAFAGSYGSLAKFKALVTRGLVRVYTPQETVEYEKTLQAEAQFVMLSQRLKPFTAPLEATLIFTIKGAPGEWPTAQGDGDVDNLEKAVFDALNGIVYTDDRLIVKKTAVKVCGDTPGVEISLRPVSSIN